MPITHPKVVTGVADDADPATVSPTDWNASHVGPPIGVALHAATSTMTNLPAALGEFFANRHRARLDLRYVTEVRLALNVSIVGNVGSEFRIQYSLDNGTTWAYIDGTSGPAAPIQPIGVRSGAWVAVAAAAKVDDLLIRPVTIGGDGVADPQVGLMVLWMR